MANYRTEVITLPRHINQQVSVTLVMDAYYGELRPAQFTYRGQRIRVKAVLERWSEAGRWWEQEPESTVWRVQDPRGGMYELAMEHKQPPEWWLRVIWD